jgi:hypothetical protein
MEVMVGILMTTTFVAVSMQGMVVATLLKAKALQISEATGWVYSDLEKSRFQATNNELPLQNTDRDLTNRCQPAANQIDGGLAATLRDKIQGSSVIGSSPVVETWKETTSTGKSFAVKRTITIVPDYPFNILGIQYEVASADNLGINLLNFYTEVMPDAALSCS